VARLLLQKRNPPEWVIGRELALLSRPMSRDDVNCRDLYVSDFNDRGYSGGSTSTDFAYWLTGYGVHDADWNRIVYWRAMCVLLERFIADGCPELQEAYSAGKRTRARTT
jgi:hypothetical protein